MLIILKLINSILILRKHWNQKLKCTVQSNSIQCDMMCTNLSKSQITWCAGCINDRRLVLISTIKFSTFTFGNDRQTSKALITDTVGPVLIFNNRPAPSIYSGLDVYIQHAPQWPNKPQYGTVKHIHDKTVAENWRMGSSML